MQNGSVIYRRGVSEERSITYASIWKRRKEIGRSSDAQVKTARLKKREERKPSQKQKTGDRDRSIGGQTQRSQSASQVIEICFDLSVVPISLQAIYGLYTKLCGRLCCRVRVKRYLP